MRVGRAFKAFLYGGVAAAAWAGWAPDKLALGPHLLLTAALFPATWVLAWASEHAFLRPARALRRRLGSRPPRATVAQPA